MPTIQCRVCKNNFFGDLAQRHDEYCELKRKLERELRSNKRDKYFLEISSHITELIMRLQREDRKIQSSF